MLPSRRSLRDSAKSTALSAQLYRSCFIHIGKPHSKIITPKTKPKIMVIVQCTICHLGGRLDTFTWMAITGYLKTVAVQNET